MMPTVRRAALLVGLLATPAAAQGLLPTPYPSGAPGAAPLNPSGAATTGMMREPYPQMTGPTSQGNPTMSRRDGGLVPSTDQRKYGVDRAPR